MSNLADVRDMDGIRSFSPLVLGQTSREVSGADAVLRRGLYRCCLRRGTLWYALEQGIDPPILDLPGTVFSAQDRLGYRLAIIRQWTDEDFVLDCGCTIRVDAAGAMTITMTPTLIDGRAYVLAVGVSDAAVALQSIGAVNGP